MDGNCEAHGGFVVAIHWQLLHLKEQAADRQNQVRRSAALFVLGARPFDFHGSDAHAIALL
jgi:hypothetical protein